MTNYICKLCNQRFISKAEAKRHMACMNDDNDEDFIAGIIVATEILSVLSDSNSSGDYSSSISSDDFSSGGGASGGAGASGNW